LASNARVYPSSRNLSDTLTPAAFPLSVGEMEPCAIPSGSSSSSAAAASGRRSPSSPSPPSRELRRRRPRQPLSSHRPVHRIVDPSELHRRRRGRFEDDDDGRQTKSTRLPFTVPARLPHPQHRRGRDGVNRTRRDVTPRDRRPPLIAPMNGGVECGCPEGRRSHPPGHLRCTCRPPSISVLGSTGSYHQRTV